MRRSRLHTRGFTLLEVLLAVLLVGSIVGPLMVGLMSMVSSTRTRLELTAIANAARGKMEDVLAQGFDNVPIGSPSTISDSLTINGEGFARDVFVVIADGDLPPDATPDTDFKHITVVVRGFELQAYLAPDL